MANIMLFEEMMRKCREDRTFSPPETVIYRGKEELVLSLTFLHDNVEERRLLAAYSCRQVHVPSVSTTFYCVQDFFIGRSENAGGLVSYFDGLPFSRGQKWIGELDPENKQRVARQIKFNYGYFAYAGKYWFVRDIMGGKEYPVRDCTVTLNEIDRVEGAEQIPLLSDVLGIPQVGSFMDLAAYASPKYSLWSEVHHGPMAQQITEQWNGNMVVPCDGGGLFASRATGVFGDAVTGPWTHDLVASELMSQTLQRGEGLQVFFFCSAFMTEDDKKLIRAPYIFVDKFPPAGMVHRFSGRNWWSSEHFFDLELTELIDYSNPAFSRNLLLLGPVTFKSSHLHSFYSEKLGMISGTGTPVSQTWSDFLDDRSRYFSLVGMHPIVRNWDTDERKYTRIVYKSTNLLAHCSYVHYPEEGCYYLYFPSPVRLTHPAKLVHAFPDVNVDTVIGCTRDQLGYPEWLLGILEQKWESEGVVWQGTYVDYRDLKQLRPYFPAICREGVSLPPELRKQYAEFLQLNGSKCRLNFFRSKNQIRYRVRGETDFYSLYYGPPSGLLRFCIKWHGTGILRKRVFYPYMKVRCKDGTLVELALTQTPSMDLTICQDTVVMKDGMIVQVRDIRL